MTAISGPARVTPLMSPRTVKYVEAMIREGDNFDYYKWLQRVCEEEGLPKRVSTTSTSCQAAPGQIGSRPSTFDNRDAPVRAAPTLMAKLLPLPRSTSRSTLKLRDKTPKARLIRWLVKARDAWDEFQTSRARDGVYGYLEAVFGIVEHYRTRRRTKRLLRHAFEFADQPLEKDADPFAAVIRCTCDGQADNKTISKWARALRYVARCKKHGTPLTAFMKGAGGVNACADRYAKLKRRCNRRN
jgi:hypothetical protein